jgi:hypothetical protein
MMFPDYCVRTVHRVLPAVFQLTVKDSQLLSHDREGCSSLPVDGTLMFEGEGHVRPASITTDKL